MSENKDGFWVTVSDLPLQEKHEDQFGFSFLRNILSMQLQLKSLKSLKQLEQNAKYPQVFFYFKDIYC